MLPKEARLREDRDFKTAFAKGRSYKGDLIVVYVLPKRGGAIRFGFSTVRKIKTAIERNRLKRLLRESARKLLPCLQPGTDIVILAHARAVGASFEEISTEANKLLARSGVLNACEERKT